MNLGDRAGLGGRVVFGPFSMSSFVTAHLVNQLVELQWTSLVLDDESTSLFARLLRLVNYHGDLSRAFPNKPREHVVICVYPSPHQPRLSKTMPNIGSRVPTALLSATSVHATSAHD